MQRRGRARTPVRIRFSASLWELQAEAGALRIGGVDEESTVETPRQLDGSGPLRHSGARPTRGRVTFTPCRVTVTPRPHDEGMTYVDDLVQLVIRLVIGIAVSLAAGFVTYVVGVWLLKVIVSLALQTTPEPYRRASSQPSWRGSPVTPPAAGGAALHRRSTSACFVDWSVTAAVRPR